MFTGIIEETAPMLHLQKRKLEVRRPQSFDDIRLGSSIAVNGCCLTISSLQEATMGFDLTEETLQKTTFPQLTEGTLLNLERAMKADSRMDGHPTQGHIDTTGEVVYVSPEKLQVRIQKEIMNSVFKKGSIAIDGVSLTIADIEGDLLTFAIVPFTWGHTIMPTYTEGRRVNVEVDILARYAEFS